MQKSSSLAVFIILVNLSCVSAHSQSGTSPAVDALRHYIESRLHWTNDFSTLITWPSEPAWDCYWVANEYSLGVPNKQGSKVVIPATYSRIGLYCHDVSFETQIKKETGAV